MMDIDACVCEHLARHQNPGHGWCQYCRPLNLCGVISMEGNHQLLDALFPYRRGLVSSLSMMKVHRNLFRLSSLPIQNPARAYWRKANPDDAPWMLTDHFYLDL